jgi:hypothetical protein
MKRIILIALAVAALISACQAKTPVTLLWTAPFDLPDTVNVVQYSLRFAESPDSLLNNWATCRQVSGMPIPSHYGQLDSVKTSQLAGDTLYYALKARDNADPTPLWSAASNICPIYIPDNQAPNAPSNFRFYLR